MIKKKKYIFFGDENSINLEIILNSHYYLKDKVKYIIIGNIYLIKTQLSKLHSKILIKKIYDPFNFELVESNKLNIFDLRICQPKAYELLAQIKFCNFLCNKTKIDLVTMPINKSIIKKLIKFNGLTEYLGQLNETKTLMLMRGENFSIIPITTHIRLIDVVKNFNKKLENFHKELNYIMKNSKNIFQKKNFVFLCVNPHCGENRTIGDEDYIIKKFTKNKIKQISADSAFKKYQKGTIFLSFYHDQALIPFKILNKFSYNQTIGLKYKRVSPSHGTATDIKFQNIADNTSYIQCMIN